MSKKLKIEDSNIPEKYWEEYEEILNSILIEYRISPNDFVDGMTGNTEQKGETLSGKISEIINLTFNILNKKDISTKKQYFLNFLSVDQ